MRLSLLPLLLLCTAALAGPVGLPGEEWTDEPAIDEQIARSTDSDNDGLSNYHDNCVSLHNPDQKDRDGDEVGDACDLCPDTSAFGEMYGCPDSKASKKDIEELKKKQLESARNALAQNPTLKPKPVMSPLQRNQIASANDADKDGVSNAVDNCIEPYNPGQEDGDGDEVGDACDLCPTIAAFGEPYGCPDGKANAADIAKLKKVIEEGRKARP